MKNNMRKLQLPGKHRILLFLSFVFSLLAANSFAQVTITGKVAEKNGATTAGLPSITVTIKGLRNGTGTDNNGAYQLSAPLKPGTYSVVFSGVGYKSEEVALVVNTATSYTVNAELTAQASKLDEVIITGTSAGTTRRQLGSYISTVSADELTKGATGNVLAALQGKTAGAQISQNSGDPAGGISVRLRGISSISSSSEPLYIIDGVIVNN